MRFGPTHHRLELLDLLKQKVDHRIILFRVTVFVGVIYAGISIAI